jgi:hypothetical protein
MSIPQAAEAGVRAESPDQPARRATEHYWLWVLCLIGLDYFSTLAYQPSITFQAAGRLGPIATGVVVLVTLLGALPIYLYLVKRSHRGQGAIGMLERVVQGWRGKTLVLIMLGFAAVDFIMLKSISLADAAVHTLESDDPGWQQALSRLAHWLQGLATTYFLPEIGAYFTVQLVATLLLSVIGFVFWFLLKDGFNRNAIALAVPLVMLFLLLNGIVLTAGLLHLADHPEVWHDWLERVQAGDWGVEPPLGHGLGWAGAVLVSVLVLPKLALGLSGFEMSMVVVPQVKGDPDDPLHEPHGRIRNTRKVLIVAALIIAVFLLASSFVACLLIPPAAFMEGGRAADRAIAYLAHDGRLTTGDTLLSWGGAWFGSLYDTITVLVLVLAGTSVMTALASLLPQFLLRFGMDTKWSQRWGVLLMLFALVNAGVTMFYQAKVSAQRDAYAVAVLVLISCAAGVTVLNKKQIGNLAAGRWRPSLLFFRVVAWGFVAQSLVVTIRGFSGLAIALGFILTILALSVISRAMRADELRTIGFSFKDDHSKLLWDTLRLADFPVLVPHRPGRQERVVKERQIRRDHQLDPHADIVFLEIEVDDPSNFYQDLLIEVVQEDHCFAIKVGRCVSVAHAIAAIALEMSRYSKPPGLHFGWSEMNLLTSSWSYFAFGEGNVPGKVRELLLSAEPDPEKCPRVIIG